MNIYLVVSEELEAVDPILDDGTGPTEVYRIAEVVAARNHGQARWLAWQTDGGLRGTYTGDPRDMPRFTVQQKKSGFDEGAPRVLTRDEVLDLMKRWPWFSPWRIGKDAPRVGLERETW